MKHPLLACTLVALMVSGCGGSGGSGDGYVGAGSHMWTDVKIYYGPSHTYIFDIVGGNENYRTPSGQTMRGVKVRYPNGNEEWKDRSNINLSGDYFVREDDPALAAQRWQVLTE